MRVNLKKVIHYLSFLLLILSYFSLSFETSLKSGISSSYSDLFIPITQVFYWPRFFLFLTPALVLIIFSSEKMKNFEFILKGFFFFSTLIIINNNINLFFDSNLIPNFNQPQQFIWLYYLVVRIKSITWIGISVLGLIWSFQKKPQLIRA